MKAAPFVLALVLAGFVRPAWPATAPAPAAKSGLVTGQHNSNAPINISSDNFVGDLQTRVGTYIGNVIVIQADDRLRADRLKVNVTAGKPDRFEATGNVVFVSASGTATGDNGIYELGPRTVTMTGHVVLTKNKDVMHGTMLVVNMVTGEAHLSARGAPGNRVQGLFIPPPQSSTPGAKPHPGAEQ
jgi:lipopolysaccharide export system protein LptA